MASAGYSGGSRSGYDSCRLVYGTEGSLNDQRCVESMEELGKGIIGIYHTTNGSILISDTQDNMRDRCHWVRCYSKADGKVKEATEMDSIRWLLKHRNTTHKSPKKGRVRALRAVSDGGLLG